MSIVSELKKQGGNPHAQTISEALPDLTKELPAPDPEDVGKIFGLAINEETGKYEVIDITSRLAPDEVILDPGPGTNV